MTGAVEPSLSRACSELARTMAAPGALVDVLSALAVQAADVLGTPAAAVLLLDPDAGLRPAAATEAPGAGLVATELNLHEGPTLEAFGTAAVVFSVDLAKEGRWPRYAREARTAGVHAVLAVPLRIGERPVGALSAVATEPRTWHVSEVTALEVLADMASGYIAHDLELDKVRRTADQLQEALESRVVIEQAKGVLVGELGCTVDQAYVLLRNHARRNHVTLRSVAQAVVHLGLRPPTLGPRGTPAAPTPDATPGPEIRDDAKEGR